MAVPIIASSTSNNVTGSSITLTKPSGVENGDLLVLIVGNDADKDGNGFLALTGWTQEFNYGDGTADAYVSMYWRVATGDAVEDSPAPPSNTSSDLTGWYFRVTGVNATSPIRVVGASQVVVSSSVTITALTTDTNTYSLAISCLATDGADLLPFTETGTGWTKGDELSQGLGGQGVGSCYSTKGIDTASTTTETSIITGSISDGIVATMFIIAGDETGEAVTEWGAAELGDGVNNPLIEATLDALGERDRAGISNFDDATATLDIAGIRDREGISNFDEATSPLDIIGSADNFVSTNFDDATSTLDVIGERDRFGISNFDDTISTLDVIGIRDRAGVSNFDDTTSTLDVLGERDLGGISNFDDATSTLEATAVGGTIRYGALDVSASSTLATIGAKLLVGASALAIAASLAVVINIDRFGDTSLETTSTLTALSSTVRNADSSLSSSTLLTAIPSSDGVLDGRADLFGTSALEAISSVDKRGWFEVNTTATLEGVASITQNAQIELSTTSTLTAIPSSDGILSGRADLFSTSALTLDGEIDREALAELNSVTTLTVTAEEGNVKTGASELEALSTLTVIGRADNFASTELSSISTLTAIPSSDGILTGRADLICHTTLIVDAEAIKSAQIGLNSTSELLIDATLSGIVQIEIFATSTLSVNTRGRQTYYVLDGAIIIDKKISGRIVWKRYEATIRS